MSAKRKLPSKAKCESELNLMLMIDYFMLGTDYGCKRDADQITLALEQMLEDCEKYHTDDGILALQRNLLEHRKTCSPMS